MLSLEEAIALQRNVFAQLAGERTVAAPNSWLRLPGEGGGWIKLLAGYDQDSRALGVKVVARFPRNPPGSNFGSLLLLFDPERGTPLAIMDAVYVTAVRTVAGAALATEALARRESRSVALVGTGVLAWYSVLAHGIRCPNLQRYAVYSRSSERREAVARRIRDEVGLEAHAVSSVDAACDGADVVVTATNSPEPVLLEEHLRPGMYIAALGIRTEIAPQAIARCRVIGDRREEALTDGKFSTALAAGVVTENDLGPDLGPVLEGLARGRTSEDQILLFDSSGVAVQDVACAHHVAIRAAEEEIGTSVAVGGDVLGAH